jgi:O-antigen ligase
MAAKAICSAALFTTLSLVINCGYIWPELLLEYPSYNLQRLIQACGLVVMLALLVAQKGVRAEATAALRLNFSDSPPQAWLLLTTAVLFSLTSLNIFGLHELTFFVATLLCAGVLSTIPPSIIALCLAVPLTVYGLLSFLQLFAYSSLGIQPSSGDIAYGFSNSRFLGHLHTVAIPVLIGLSLHFGKSPLLRYFGFSVASLTICHLILAGNRGSATSVVIATLIATIAFRKQMLPFIGGLALSSAIAAVLALFLSAGWSGADEINLTRTGTSGRLDLWLDSAIKILDAPLLGYGAGNFQQFMSGSYALSTPHNSLLLVAFEHGLPATLLLALVTLGFLSKIAKRLLRDEANTIQVSAGISLAAALIHSMVSGIQLTPTGQLGLCSIFGILMWRGESVATARKEISRISRGIFLLCLSITLLLLCIQLMIAVFAMVSPDCITAYSGMPRVWRYLDSPCY